MIQKIKELASKRVIKSTLQAGKWILLFAFLFVAFRYIQWDEVKATFKHLSVSGLLIYLGIILVSRFLYAYRWYFIGKIVIKKPQIPFLPYFYANLLAEFVTIAMPTSIGGEVTRVLKLNSQGSRTTLSTATILIDRALGILGMVIVSLTALILLGRRLTFNLQGLIPEKWQLPIILILIFLVIMVGVVMFFWLRKPNQSGRLVRAWSLVKENVGLLVFALLLSIIAHIIFSLAHYFLFLELHALSLLEVIAVVLTPQLARSIPVSVLGISAGEGLMVASQMMVGVSRETALIITFIALTSRYFFAFLGFLIEFLKDGIRFFRHEPSIIGNGDPKEQSD